MEARMREFEAQFEPVEDERYELLPEDYECDGEGNCNDEEAGNEGCFCYCGKEECKQLFKCSNFAMCGNADQMTWYYTRTAPVCNECDVNYGAKLVFVAAVAQCPVCLEDVAGNIRIPGCERDDQAVCVACFNQMSAQPGQVLAKCPVCRSQAPPPWALKANKITLEEWRAGKRRHEAAR